MAFNVRLFFFKGIQQMPNVLPKQYSADSVYVLVQPYIAGDLQSVGGVAISSDSAPAGTNLVRIEVPDGQTIRYEINPSNREGGVVVANVNSPSLSGKDQFYCKDGWSVSMIDAAGLP